MLKLLINFASRSRPIKMFNCLDNVRELSTLKNYSILLKLDEDDPDTNTAAVRKKLQFYPEVQTEWGYSKSKIDSINRGIGAALEPWTILLNFSDDQLFTVKGFDEIIVNDIRERFPDGDGFLHYPDSSPMGVRIPTMSIMGRKYFERDGFVYHPGFESVYADNYAMAVAQKREKYKFIDKPIYCHNHYLWNKTEIDQQYARQNSKEMYSKDHATFVRLMTELK
jgi:hypothetical protein